MTAHISRPQAIERIREMLVTLTGEDECSCSTTARYGVLCRGLTGLSLEDLRKKYPWIARPRPKATREELIELVTLYHLGRQTATGAALCCDVETREHCGCDGWNLFDNPTLERFYQEMTGEPVEIG
jgi:hypothetical protein